MIFKAMSGQITMKYLISSLQKLFTIYSNIVEIDFIRVDFDVKVEGL